jgi:hypothetical protein
VAPVRKDEEGASAPSAKMSGMRADDLPARPLPRRPALEATLFSRAAARAEPHDAVLEELREVRERLRRAERKLEAIEALEEVDRRAIRAVTTHTRLVCRPSGYALHEVDEPPPTVGEVTPVDDDLYVVERLAPSPLPDDPRRCAVVVPLA